VDRLSRKWAENFTSKLSELSVADPVFGELRNVMDLCIVAALIESQDLQSLAICDLSNLASESSIVKLTKLDVPNSLDPQCSFIQTAKGWVVSASGGVQVDSWQIASQIKVNDAVSSVSNSGAVWANEDRVWQ